MLEPKLRLTFSGNITLLAIRTEEEPDAQKLLEEMQLIKLNTKDNLLTAKIKQAHQANKD